MNYNKNMKKITLCFILLLTACSSPNTGNIDDATILNWENERVTTEQFVKDHKKCLGADKPAHIPRSRIAKLLSPNQSEQMPDWGGMWVSFQSNEYTDTGQRSLMSVPKNSSSKTVGYYRKCMFARGYLLRAM